MPPMALRLYELYPACSGGSGGSTGGAGELHSTGATCLLCRRILHGAGIDTAARKLCEECGHQTTIAEEADGA